MTNLLNQSIGRYHILEQIGEGGMATVFKAYDTRLERDVAIKIIRRGAFPPDQLEHMLKRFEREAKSLAKLSHPNIVGVIDYGEYEESPYLVMVYLPGGTLKQRLGQPVPWQDAVRLLIPIAQALEYAHQHNIIHRDVKPANILLTENGQPMLSDFGIAKILETDGVATLTGTGVGIGTPDYMAPEQWTGTSTTQSDIYSLGVVLYEMVTGRKPYIADTPVAILLKQTSDQLPRPTQFAPNLPDAVEKILLKALAKNLQDRYQNMSEFLAALDRLNYQNDRVSSMKPATVTQLMDNVEKGQPLETEDGFRTILEVESTRSPRKKTVWWPWAIGAGGLVCCFALVIIFIALGGSTSTIFLPSPPTVPLTPTMIPSPTATAPPVVPPPVIDGCNPADECPDTVTVRSLFPEGAALDYNVEHKVSISPKARVRFSIGWCAVDTKTLDENLTHMEFVFTVNSQSFIDQMKTNRFTEADADDPKILMACYSVGGVAREWPPSQTYRIVFGIRIKNSINDGWDNFSPADLLRIYVITTNP